VRKGGLLPRAAPGKDGWAVTKEDVEEDVRNKGEEESGGGNGDARGSGRFSADYVSLGIREPEYEVRRTRRTG
jgi:magnesium transporter